jgi:type VI protein secretion system component Hcp
MGSGTGSIIGPTLSTSPMLGATFDGGEFVVKSYSWGETLPPPVLGGGGGASKATLQEFQLELQAGTADPVFLADAASGRHITKVVVHVRTGSRQEYQTYTLSDVFITSYQTDSGGIASLKLYFGQIAESYSPINLDGSLGTAVMSSWNQVNNTGSGTGSIVGPMLSTSAVLGATFDGGEFVVQSYAWGETSTASTGGGGGGAGKSVLQDFQLQLQPGSEDPVLLADAASGEHLPSVVVHVRTGTGKEYLTYTLTDVFITSYQTGSSGIASLNLYFAQIAESYSPLNPDGSLGTAIVSSWNQQTTTGAGDTIQDPAPPTPTVVSDSFNITETANQRYVAAVYGDVLGRPVDMGGLAYWSTQLDQGAARANLVRLIDHSAEFFSTIIKPAYQQFLGRAADQAGVDYWVGRMIGGLTDEQLEAGFIGSPEFYQHAGGTDKAWIDAVYMSLLGRQADPPGESFWVGRLAQGADRAAVALGFAASLEREAQHVMGLYEKYLGRGAGLDEINYWVGQFKMGFTNEDIVTGFVSSDEYYNNHTSN